MGSKNNKPMSKNMLYMKKNSINDSKIGHWWGQYDKKFHDDRKVNS